MTIEISKMIVHKLNIDGEAPILSDHCINLNELEDTEEALKFFITHIEQSRSQGFVKKCQFWGLPNNSVKVNAETIISHLENSEMIEEKLVEESQKMARKFFRLIRRTSSKSDGSLFVLLYSVDGENYIGIMKMDPDTGVEVMDDLSIKVRKDMLPSKREKLHKAAFIKCLDTFEGNELHLYALDRQKNSSEPAKFFMEDFLNVKILPNDENLTVAYQKIMATVFQEELPPNVYMEFSQRFQKRLTEASFFTLEDDFPPLIRDLLPADQRDSDLDFYTRAIQHELMQKSPGEVTGFMPVIQKVNDSVYRTRDKSIEITIDKVADPETYCIVMEENGALVLTIFPEAKVRKIK